MNVLYDYQAFSQRVGGVSRYHTELLKHLPDFGIHTRLPNILSDNVYLRDSGFKYRSCPKRIFGKYRSYIMAYLNQLICKNAVLKKDYDIFHATFVNPYYQSTLGSKPLVVTVHDLIQEKTQRNDAKITAHRRLQQLRRADAIICVSEQTKEDLINYYPEVSIKDISTIYHGNTQDIPMEFGPRLYKFPYILYVGSREAYKNFPNILQAMYQLPGDIYLICTGTSFSSEEIKMIDTLHLNNRVIHHFATDIELMNLYHYAEAFVYPSKMEGFGIPILEAFRLKCPAVVSDIKCFNEVGGDSVKYFDPDKSESISTVIKTVLESSVERQNLICKGLERLKQFSWEKSIEKHAKLYCKLI